MLRLKDELKKLILTLTVKVVREMFACTFLVTYWRQSSREGRAMCAEAGHLPCKCRIHMVASIAMKPCDH